MTTCSVLCKFRLDGYTDINERCQIKTVVSLLEPSTSYSDVCSARK